MINKYPTEFEEIYQRVVVNKEPLHKVIKDYSEMMKRENMKMMGIVLGLEKYINDRSKRKNTLDLKID